MIQIDNFTFHNADNMEIMAQYPDKYFDLAIVDPPYGLDLANMNMGIGKSKKASKIQNRKWQPKDWDKNAPNTHENGNCANRVLGVLAFFLKIKLLIYKNLRLCQTFGKLKQKIIIGLLWN